MRFHSLKLKTPILGQECIVMKADGTFENNVFFSRGADGTDKKFITWYGEIIDAKYWLPAQKMKVAA